jgi:hypothetical protein
VEKDENVIVLFDIEHYRMKIAIILILILGGENGGGNTSYKTFSVFLRVGSVLHSYWELFIAAVLQQQVRHIRSDQSNKINYLAYEFIKLILELLTLTLFGYMSFCSSPCKL